MKSAWVKAPNDFKAKITGKLLGDGAITKQAGRSARFKFNHTYKDYKWCYYCYNQLAHSIPLSEPKFNKTIDSRLKKGYSLQYYVQSRVSDVICYLRNRWYPEGKKSLPCDLIQECFTEQTLAWWYMDDGHFKIERNIPKKIVLSTDSFTSEENKWLIDFLYKKYKLSFNLDNQNRIILYDQFQIIYFLNLIKPYLHESMYRKTFSSRPILFNLSAKRTTIYLPISIHITSPTKEINSQLKLLPKLVEYYKKGVFYKKFEKLLFLDHGKKKKSYQIVINGINLSNLQLLKSLTGLTYSKLTELCFIGT